MDVILSLILLWYCAVGMVFTLGGLVVIDSAWVWVLWVVCVVTRLLVEFDWLSSLLVYCALRIWVGFPVKALVVAAIVWFRACGCVVVLRCIRCWLFWFWVLAMVDCLTFILLALLCFGLLIVCLLCWYLVAVGVDGCCSGWLLVVMVAWCVVILV